MYISIRIELQILISIRNFYMPNSNQAISMEIDQAELDQLKQQLIEDLNKTGITKITYHPGKLEKIVKLLSAINLSDITELKKIKNELSSSPADLKKLIDYLGNNFTKQDKIDFNKKTSKLILKLYSINVNNDNSQILTDLNQQLKKLEKLNISELMLFSKITNKIEELSKIQVELDSFVDESIKNMDLRNIIMNLPTIIKKEQNIHINILLHHFNENQICDITDDNAQSICEVLLSICSIKNFDHEICFKLIECIIKSGSLKNEYYQELAKNLVEYSGAESPLNNVIQHLTQNAKKQNNIIDLSNLLDVAIEDLKSENVNVILNWFDLTTEKCQDHIENFRKKKASLLQKNKLDKIQIDKLDKIINYFEIKKLNEELKKVLNDENPNKDYNTIVSLINLGANFKIINKETLEEISESISKELDIDILNEIRSYLQNLVSEETSRAVNSSNEVETSATNKLTLIDIINIIRSDKKNYPLSIKQWNAVIDCLRSTDNLFHWERKLRNSSDCAQEFKKVLIEFNNKNLSDKKQVLDSLLITAINESRPQIVKSLLENGANLSEKEQEINWLQLALRKNFGEQDKILEILKILTSKMSETQLNIAIIGLLNKAIELGQQHILDFIFATSFEGENKIDQGHQSKRQQLEAKLIKNENKITQTNLHSSSRRQNKDIIDNLNGEQEALIDEWLKHVQFIKLIDKVKEETDIKKLSNVKKCLDFYKEKYQSSNYPECLYKKFSKLHEEVQAKIFSLESVASNSQTHVQMDVDGLVTDLATISLERPGGDRRRVYSGGAERGMSYLFAEQPAVLPTEPAIKRRAASQDGGSQPKVSIGLFYDKAQPMSSVQEDQPMETSHTHSP